MAKLKLVSNKVCFHCNSYLKEPTKGLQCNIFKITGYDTRIEKFDGRDYLVAPVVLMKVGVHSGSNGPTFYSADELSKFPAAWNGRPLPVYHPENDLGPISANSPSVLQAQVIGQVFNAYYDEPNEALKGEVWVDIEKASRVSPTTLSKIENKEQMEVSTGVFTEDELFVGNYKGKDYKSIAHNLRPDHLALLPGQVGACSIKDGCGLRNNTEEAPKITITNTKTEDENPMKEKLIQDLIANTLVKFTEEDKPFLETLKEEMLEKMTPVMPEVVAPVANAEDKKEDKEITVNAEQAFEIIKDTLNTPEKFLALLPKEYQESFTHGLALHTAEKNTIVAKIVENSKFTAEMLNDKPIEELSIIADAIVPVVNRALQGNTIAPTTNSNKAVVEPLLPIEIK